MTRLAAHDTEIEILLAFLSLLPRHCVLDTSIQSLSKLLKETDVITVQTHLLLLNNRHLRVIICVCTLQRTDLLIKIRTVPYFTCYVPLHNRGSVKLPFVVIIGLCFSLIDWYSCLFHKWSYWQRWLLTGLVSRRNKWPYFIISF